MRKGRDDDREPVTRMDAPAGHGHLLWTREDARPSATFEVLGAPFDVVLAHDAVLVPDVLVARYADMTDKELPVAPLLAVEVLSPSTRRVDLTLKRSRYEAAGCPSSWIVDPEEPALTAWELPSDGYVRLADVCDDETCSARLPYPVDVTLRARRPPTGTKDFDELSTKAAAVDVSSSPRHTTCSGWSHSSPVGAWSRPPARLA